MIPTVQIFSSMISKGYEHDIEIGVLDFNASEIEINLPFEVSNNSIVRFSFEHWDYGQQESVINECRSRSSSSFV